MEGPIEGGSPFPQLPTSFLQVCESNAHHWPVGWQSDFAKSNYFYLAGFVDYLNDRLKELNVTVVERQLNAVLDRAVQNIPDRWLGIEHREDMDTATRLAKRERKLAELTLTNLDFRKIKSLRFKQPVSFYSTMLVVACLRELMVDDPDDSRRLEDVVEVRWAGYMVHPWFSDFYANRSASVTSQLMGYTGSFGELGVFEDAAAGHPVTLPLAKRLRKFVRITDKTDAELPIYKITNRSDPEHRTGAKMKKRPAYGELLPLIWPAPSPSG